MSAIPVLRVREWSTTTPDTPDSGRLLRNVTLTDGDRHIVDQLAKQSSLRVVELRQGLSITVGPHIGALTLSGIRIVVMPKLKIDRLMRMVAYAFDLGDIRLSGSPTTYSSGESGLVDLLGLSLLRAAEHIARGGILPNYHDRTDDLVTPRGRLDFRHLATEPRRATLRCVYEDFTVDHELNRVLAAGLRFAARVMLAPDLRIELARVADRCFGDLERVPLDGERIRRIVSKLDRRSSHYRTALVLVSLLYEGAHLESHERAGVMPLSGFTLNMNMVFERFLARYLAENAPSDVRIDAQETRSDVFEYIHNAGNWARPTIRPDFVVRHRNEVIAVADAKYKNRHEHPPSSDELYQLTVYGLSYSMPEPREVLMLHPVTATDPPRTTTLQFAPHSSSQHVQIRLVGVPLDSILDTDEPTWWPFDGANDTARIASELRAAASTGIQD